MIIGLVDYAAGNRTSVERALRHLGIEFRVVSAPEDFAGLDKVIFPGVGEARAAMDVLLERGLARGLKEAVAAGIPLLGICIGCQLVLDRSEERATECLGLIPGESKRFPRLTGLKIPQIGWNQVEHANRHAIFAGIPDGSSFFFDHSYYPVPSDPHLEVGATEYGVRFSSAFARGNVVAVQFHPEKSGKFGLQMLGNFARWEVPSC